MRSIKRLVYSVLASSLILTTTSCGEFIDIFSPTIEDNGEGSELNNGEAFQAPLSGVILQKGSDQSGQIDEINDMQIISAEYQVRLKDPELGQTAHIQIPLSQVPEDLENQQIQVERFDESTGQWQAAGNFAWYDQASKSVWFRDQLPIENAAVGDLSTQQLTSKNAKYRIRIYIFSNDLTAYREGSQFRITYYPSHLGNKNRVKSDSEWNSPNGSQQSDVPDFIEDLDTALNEAYQAMLKISHSEGKAFKPLPIQDVYVTHTGGNAGDSGLGGPLRISNSHIDSYKDMQLTAAHELAHVFQGQYYSLQGLFGGQSNNTWFIEASANYYAARVNDLDDAAKKAFYTDFYTDYLSVPLTSNSDNSMYAAGHFLDWLSQKYGPNLVGDALRLSSGNDMIGLSKAIQLASNGSTSIADAYEDYIEEILTQPEDTAGFNLDIRNAMAKYLFGDGYLSAIVLNGDRRYARIKKDLPPLTAAMISINVNRFKNPADNPRGLFVMANNDNKGALLKGQTYLMESSLNQSYLDARPIDKYLNHNTFTEVHEFTTFDDLSQMMYNVSPASSAKIDMSYYILGSVVSKNAAGDKEIIDIKQSLGDIPRDYIQGFKVYDYKGDLFKGPIPLPSQGDFIELELPGPHFYHFTTVDKFGNEWPYQIILGYDTDSTFLEYNETARLTAHTIGFEDDDLKWDIQSDGWGEPGKFSAGGKQASFSLDINTAGSVRITATSSKYPFLSDSVSFTDTMGGCVAAGTVVTLADGSRKAIEQLQAGDVIQAWHEDSNQVVSAQVKQLLIHQDAAYTLHRVQGADGDEIQITGNHPVYTKESGWIPVDQLKAGMTLYQMDHLTQRFVETQVKGIIREESKSNVVYNLLTSEGNYFANDLLIHNKCLAAGSLIDTPAGQMAVENLKPGSQVYDRNGQITQVQRVYRKETVLATLPGKRLPEGTEVTNNHQLFWQGRWQAAGQTDLPAVTIAGTVYDLQTEQGSYRSGSSVMGQEARAYID